MLVPGVLMGALALAARRDTRIRRRRTAVGGARARWSAWSSDSSARVSAAPSLPTPSPFRRTSRPRTSGLRWSGSRSPRSRRCSHSPSPRSIAARDRRHPRRGSGDRDRGCRAIAVACAVRRGRGRLCRSHARRCCAAPARRLPGCVRHAGDGLEPRPAPRHPRRDGGRTGSVGRHRGRPCDTWSAVPNVVGRADNRYVTSLEAFRAGTTMQHSRRPTARRLRCPPRAC